MPEPVNYLRFSLLYKHVTGREPIPSDVVRFVDTIAADRDFYLGVDQSKVVTAAAFVVGNPTVHHFRLWQNTSGKIRAIKYVREEIGCSLKDAKEAVEAEFKRLDAESQKAIEELRQKLQGES